MRDVLHSCNIILGSDTYPGVSLKAPSLYICHMRIGPSTMGTDCEEELQTSDLPQLEARLQRGPDHVCHVHRESA